MIDTQTLIIWMLQISFYETLHVQAVNVVSIASRGIGMAANDFVTWDVVGRNLVVDDDNDNGSSVSHKVMQAIVVVLVLFLLFLFALFLFRKHRLRRLQQRWQLRPTLRVAPLSQTFHDSSAHLMSEIPIAPPPTLPKNTYRTEGHYYEAPSRQFSHL